MSEVVLDPRGLTNKSVTVGTAYRDSDDQGGLKRKMGHLDV